MSKWGNFNFDISSVGKVIKNVERSIDKAIGIPEGDGTTNDGGDQDSMMISTSPSSGIFGYTFSSPIKSNITTTTTTTTSTTPNKQQTPNIKSPILNTPTESQPKTPNIKSPISNNSPILIAKTNLVESLSDSESSNNTTNNDISPIKLIQEHKENEVDDEKIQNLNEDISIVSSSVDSSSIDIQSNPIPTVEIKLIESNTPNSTTTSEIETKKSIPEQPSSITLENEISLSTINNNENNSINENLSESELKVLELENKLNSITIIYREKEKILNEREKQIENLTKQLSKVLLSNEELLKDIDKMNSDRKKEDIENLKEEFSRRIGQLEKKLKDTTKERDSLKSGTHVSESTTGQLKERDERIQLLLQEGTALSMKVSNLEATIKKQRNQIKEQEEKQQLLSDRIESTDVLLLQRSERLKELEESDKKYQDAINTMREVSELANKRFDERDKDAGRATKQLTDLQLALDKAWKENSEMQKQHQSEIDRLMKQITDVKLKREEDFQVELNLLKKEFQAREDQLEATVYESRQIINQNAEKWKWRESDLNREIEHLQGRCREVENRNDQISSSIPDATRPLLKQIESLEISLQTRQSAFDSIEKSLQSQLKEEKIKYQLSEESHQELQLELDELSKKLKFNELQLKKSNKSFITLQNELQSEKEKYLNLHSQQSNQDNFIQSLQSQISKYDLKIKAVEEKLEKSKKEIKDLKEIDEKREKSIKMNRNNSNNNLTNQNNNSTPIKNPLSFSTNELFLPSTPNNNQNNNLNQYNEPLSPTSSSPLSNSSSGFTPNKNYFGFKRIPSQHDFQQQQHFSNEFLQSSFQQKDAEITMLQVQNQSLETSRKKLEDELVKLTTQNENLLLECKDIKNYKTEIQQLNQRYSTALDVLGEKEEIVNEMKLDILDLKDLYKSQINELLLQIDQLKLNK